MEEGHRQVHNLQDQTHLDMGHHLPNGGLVPRIKGHEFSLLSLDPSWFWVITTSTVGWVKILRYMNFLKNENRYFSSVKILWDMNFLKNETRYFSSGSNHPDGEVLY